jgi:hypothetical protein
MGVKLGLSQQGKKRVRVFGNVVLRRIFRPKREEVAGVWTSLHNEELHNLYVSPNIIRVIKSGSMRWTGHVARMGEVGNACSVLVGKPLYGLIQLPATSSLLGPNILPSTLFSNFVSLV